MKKTRLNTTRGITLIALVVTIVVLLILAGTSISMLAGEDGIIEQAQRAKKETEIGEEKEKIDLAISGAASRNDSGIVTEENLIKELDNLIGAGMYTLEGEGPYTVKFNKSGRSYTIEASVNVSKAGEEVRKPSDKNWDETKVTPIADGEGNTIPVPKGFYYAGGTKDTGFVISDVPNDNLDNTAGGNQFVWIPCTDSEYTDAKDDVMDKKWPSNNEYKDNGDNSGSSITTPGTGNGLGWRDTYTNDDKTMLDKTYTDTNILPTQNWVAENQIEKGENSIKIYDGFYIARFEAGIPSEATSFYTTGATEYIITGRGVINETNLIENLKPVSKKGVQAWNCITQPNSKMVAENMYDADSSVDSYLVDSQAWNLICNKFNEILENSDPERTITNSTKWGNYWDNTTTDYTKINCLYAIHEWSSSDWKSPQTYGKGLVPDNTAPKGNGNNRLELATGASDDFKVYNIYDMAGNMWEWTTSHTIKGKEMFVVPRGGSFSGDDGSACPVVHANGHNWLTDGLINVGFRVVLYVK